MGAGVSGGHAVGGDQRPLWSRNTPGMRGGGSSGGVGGSGGGGGSAANAYAIVNNSAGGGGGGGNTGVDRVVPPYSAVPQRYQSATLSSKPSFK